VTFGRILRLQAQIARISSGTNPIRYISSEIYRRKIFYRKASHFLRNRMANFETWQYQNLVQFAKEATERMNLLNAEVEALNADLKAAINAYRDLLRRDTLGFLETSHTTEAEKASK
jgi:hypothetical protein